MSGSPQPRSSVLDSDAVDRVVHEPARLAIMTALLVMESADFVFVMNETGLTKGNLSSHMTKLEEVGYIRVDKTFVGKTPRTVLALTGAGRAALKTYKAWMTAAIAPLPD